MTLRNPLSRWPSAVMLSLAFFVAPASAQGNLQVNSATPRVESPATLHALFVKAFNAGDLDALVKLFESTAGFVPQPGQVVVGHEGIRSVLKSFLALNGTLELSTVHAVEVGNLALLRGHYKLKGVDPSGKADELGGRTVEVARKQQDGGWLYAIDFPQGAD